MSDFTDNLMTFDELADKADSLRNMAQALNGRIDCSGEEPRFVRDNDGEWLSLEEMRYAFDLFVGNVRH